MLIYNSFFIIYFKEQVFPWILFINLFFSVDAIEPLRWLAAIVMPITVAKWGLARRSLSVSGAASGKFVMASLTTTTILFLPYFNFVVLKFAS